MVTKVSTLHRDALGSVRAVTNAAGLKAERSLFRPFGEEASTRFDPATAAETKGFIGQRYDADAGLQYLNARYYDPKLGMFIQPDWWDVTKAGTNRFGYCGGDPANCTDANGHVPDNWATKEKPVAYTSGGWTYTYQGKSVPDKAVYKSWKDTSNPDYKKYVKDTGTKSESSWGSTKGTVGILEEKMYPKAGKFGKAGVGYTYGEVYKVPVLLANDPGLSANWDLTNFWPNVVLTGAGGYGIVRNAFKAGPEMLEADILLPNKKGVWNFGYGTATKTQADELGGAWVGTGSRVASDAKTFVSADGLRQYRPPAYKPYLDRFQANLEFRLEPRGPWIGNAHLDVVE